MSMSFDSEKLQIRNLRERSCQMSDQELIAFGRTLGGIPKRVSGVPDAYDALAETREE